MKPRISCCRAFSIILSAGLALIGRNTKIPARKIPKMQRSGMKIKKANAVAYNGKRTLAKSADIDIDSGNDIGSVIERDIERELFSV